MASLVTMQHSLNAGELSPQMWGRLDLKKYSEGTSTCRNFIVNYRGGVMSRPGLAYVGTCKQPGSLNPPRDIPFQFSNTQGLVLEFGELYMRIKQNGAYVTESPITVSSVSSSGLFTTSSNHGYSVGDWVYDTGNSGFTGLSWIINTTPALNTFTVTSLFGVPVTSATASTSGTVARLYTVVSPYTTIDLPYLKYTQSADVMTFTCVNTDTGTEYPPYNLVRSGATSWAFNQITFGAVIQAPINVTAIAYSSSVVTTWYSYVVTAVDRDTGEESVASDSVNIQNNDIGVYLGSNTISWSPVVGASSYNIYKATPSYSSTVPVSSLYGFMATSLGTSAVDNNITPDFTVVPPQHTDPFVHASITDIVPYEAGINYSQSTVSYTITTSTGAGFDGQPVVTNGGVTGFLETDPGQDYASTDTITFSDSGGGIASGELVGAANPADKDYLLINGVKCFWRAAPITLGAFECYLGPTLADSIQSMVQMLNGLNTSSIFVATYSGNATTLFITYKQPGTAGNSFTIGSSSSNFVAKANTTTLGGAKTITNIDTTTQTIPVFTSASHGFTAGQTVYVSGIVGTTFYNNANWVINTVPNGNQFTLKGLSGTIYADTSPFIQPWVSGGQAQLVTVSLGASSVLTGGGVVGTGARALLKVGVSSGTYPGVCTYFQQRRVYGASLNNPDTYWMSQTGLFNNMDSSIPVTDSDSITGTPWAQQVNGIQFLIPMPGGLVVFTGRGAWQLGGGNSASITPSNQDAIPQAYIGCNQFLQPIPVNYDILYCPSKGHYIRDMSYNFFFNIYTSTDITFLSNHLFDNHWITQWCYAEEPYKLIWLVREDGVLLCLTYIKDQEIFSWTRHDTNGEIVGVCSITEPPVDAVYCITKRYIIGPTPITPIGWVYYAERFDDRLWGNVEQSFCVDSGVTTKGALASETLYPQAASGDSVIFKTTVPIFSSASVGYVIRVDGGKAVVTAYYDPYTIMCNIVEPLTKTIPNDPNNIPLPASAETWSYALPSSTFSGLNHLEGMEVAILADGSVVSNQVVTNGIITLPYPASYVTVGLPYVCQVQTLYLEHPDNSGGTSQTRRKNIDHVGLRVQGTRGLQIGTNQVDASTQQNQATIPWTNMNEVKERTNLINAGTAVPMFTGDIPFKSVTSGWDEKGQVAIQQMYPLPANILSVVSYWNSGDDK